MFRLICIDKDIQTSIGIIFVIAESGKLYTTVRLNNIFNKKVKIDLIKDINNNEKCKFENIFELDCDEKKIFDIGEME